MTSIYYNGVNLEIGDKIGIDNTWGCYDAYEIVDIYEEDGETMMKLEAVDMLETKYVSINDIDTLELVD